MARATGVRETRRGLGRARRDVVRAAGIGTREAARRGARYARHNHQGWRNRTFKLQTSIRAERVRGASGRFQSPAWSIVMGNAAAFYSVFIEARYRTIAVAADWLRRRGDRIVQQQVSRGLARRS